MSERYSYATSGVPIVCDYTVNGVLAKVWASFFRRNGTAPIGVVEIISHGNSCGRASPVRGMSSCKVSEGD